MGIYGSEVKVFKGKISEIFFCKCFIKIYLFSPKLFNDHIFSSSVLEHKKVL